MRIQRVVLMSALALIQVSVIGCAALIPERAPLTWKLEGLTRENEPTIGQTRWLYTLVIENPGRLPATLIQEAVTLGWDGVYRSEIERTPRQIMGRSAVRLPFSSVFRRSDFEADSHSSPGRSPNAPQRTEGMRISWQFLGRYEGGGAIILNVDFFPERIK
jgi:hypothetical protein